MPRKPPDIELIKTELLPESEHRSTSMSLPLAIHQRLDAMAELARGVKASRAEIIAALIAETPLDQSAMRRRINEYRERTVGEVYPADPAAAEADSDDKVIRMRPRQPGRPRSAAD